MGPPRSAGAPKSKEDRSERRWVPKPGGQDASEEETSGDTGGTPWPYASASAEVDSLMSAKVSADSASEAPLQDSVCMRDATGDQLLEFFSDNVECVAGAPVVLRMRLGGCQLGDRSALKLARYVEDLLHWDLRARDRTVVDGFDPTATWADVELDRNELGDACFVALIDVFQRCRVSVRRFVVSNNRLTDSSVLKLASLISDQALPVEEVDLTLNWLSARSLIALCMEIAHSRRRNAQPRLAPPCWVCLHSNRIAEPLQVVSLLETHAQVATCSAEDLSACNSSRCSHAGVCGQACPEVHLFNLASQRQDALVVYSEAQLVSEICSRQARAVRTPGEEAAGAGCILLGRAKHEHAPAAIKEVDSTAVGPAQGQPDERSVPQAPRRPDSTAAAEGPPLGASGVSPGQTLLGLLRTPPPSDMGLYQEPVPTSRVEEIPWKTHPRPGAPEHSVETVWPLEENLAANRAAAARPVPEAAKVSQLPLGDQGARTLAVTQAIERLNIGIAEAVKCAAIEPLCLKETLRYVVNEGWENITWKKQYTALHLAAEHGRDDVVLFLLAVQADPGAQDSKGRTALDVAEKKQQWNAAWTLLQAKSCQGLDDVMQVAVARRGARGQTATDLTELLATRAQARQQQQKPQDLGALTDKYQRLKFALCEMLAILKLNPACVKAVLYMVATGRGGIECQGWFTTALHLAAELGRDDLIPLLMALGAEADVVDSNGRKAIEVARAHQHWGCVWRLSNLGEIRPEEDAKGSQPEVPGAIAVQASAEPVRLRATSRPSALTAPQTATDWLAERPVAAGVQCFVD